MIWAYLGVVAIALIAVFAALATGRWSWDPMAPPVHTAHEPGLPAVPHARDVDNVRFNLALRGYRADQVDLVLDTLRDRIAEQDAEIQRLRHDLQAPTPADAGSDIAASPHG